MTDPPDSPVLRVEVEHEDGTTRELRGKDARAWVNWVARATEFTCEHGGRRPDMEWEEDA